MVTSGEQSFGITGSRHFVGWLQRMQASIAVSTYQAGKLFMLGSDGDGKLSLFERSFDRAMGVWASATTLWLGTRFQLWRLEDILGGGVSADGYDRVYLPQVAYTTGDVELHEVQVGADDRPLFVSSLFNCLARTDERCSLDPVWRPPFVSAYVAEDRCHLNGVAMVEGRARYATCVATSNVVDGWRDHRRDGGVVIDIDTGATVCAGLSMPHSPRWHRGRLWLLDSGNGHFGWVDLARGRFEPVALCPGFARGLDFIGDHAVVGLSLPRDVVTFRGLALAQNLEAQGATPRCGILVINTVSGAAEHWLRFEGPVTELFDVRMVPGVRRAKLIGLLSDEIARTVKVGSA